MDLNCFGSGEPDITVKVEGFSSRQAGLKKSKVDALQHMIVLCVQTAWSVLENERNHDSDARVSAEKVYEEIKSGDRNPIPRSSIEVDSLSKQSMDRFTTLIMNFLTEILTELSNGNTAFLPEETTLKINLNNDEPNPELHLFCNSRI